MRWKMDEETRAAALSTRLGDFSVDLAHPVGSLDEIEPRASPVWSGVPPPRD
jgi:hypothetical protein